jgi:hypothetical protein
MSKTTIPTGGITDATIATGDIADSAVTVAKTSGVGVTSSSQFRLSATLGGDANPIANNWEEVDTDGYGGVGTAVSQSSGIFTFPSTGFWLIRITAGTKHDNTNNYGTISIDSTVNNSSYNSAADANTSYTANPGADQYKTTSCEFMFDVTNTTTHKVRFSVFQQNNDANTIGNSGNNSTVATFIRLGDT